MANDTYQLNVIAAVADEYCENILHFQTSASSSSTPAADALAVITQFRAAIEPLWTACLSTDWQLGGYKCKRINNTGGPTAIAPVAGVVGGYGTGSVASGIGPLITATYYDAAAVKPRWRDGRIFMTGAPAGSCVGNVWQAAMIAAINNLTAIMIAPLGGALTPQYVVWTKHTGLAKIPVSMQLSAKVGTQRRRYVPVF